MGTIWCRGCVHSFPNWPFIDYVHMEEWYWRNGGYARTSGAMGEILEKTYVCNERTRRVLINDFGRDPESVETLYIGVDQEQYDETKVEAGLVRKGLNIAEDRLIILFPCRIHPAKASVPHGGDCKADQAEYSEYRFCRCR